MFLISADSNNTLGDINQIFWEIKTKLFLNANCAIQKNAVPHSKYLRCQLIARAEEKVSKKTKINISLPPTCRRKPGQSVGSRKMGFFSMQSLCVTGEYKMDLYKSGPRNKCVITNYTLRGLFSPRYTCPTPTKINLSRIQVLKGEQAPWL